VRAGARRLGAGAFGRGWVQAGILAAVVLLPGGGALSGGPPEAQGFSALDPEVQQRLEAVLPPEGLRVIVALHGWDLPPVGPERRAAVAQRQQSVLDALPAGSFRAGRRFATLVGFSGWAREPALRALGPHPEVARVYLDGTVHASLAQGTTLVGAAKAESVGFTGSGVAVAVLDTGVDTDHGGLADAIVAEQCFCDDHLSPNVGCCPGGGPTESGPGAAEDDDGHGTAVTGIVTSPSGTAPDAPIAAIKVLGKGGSGNFSDVAAGLDWVLTEGPGLGVRVVNLSLGDVGQYDDENASPCAGTLTAAAIAALAAIDVSVFASSGNEAHLGGISFPACVADAISVGGVYDAALGTLSWCADATCDSFLCTDPDTQADDFVCHTNSGSLLDLLAPDWRTVTTKLGGGTAAFGGTSAASPYAAGQATLLYQAEPALTHAEVRSLLVSHGPLVTNEDNGLAFPRSDVAAALTTVIGGEDSDGDGVPDDGDGSGTVGDAPCADGETALCDDNCPSVANPGQEDADGDGVGDVCDAVCGDGLDNDGDGLIDHPDDPGCRNADAGNERPACDDDFDNDGDGGIDWDGGVGGAAPDPDCSEGWRDREASGSGSCGLGIELALVLPGLWVALRRARLRAASAPAADRQPSHPG